MATILLGALITLTLFYALVLFIRGIARLAHHSNQPARSGGALLCASCAILHGRRGDERVSSARQTRAGLDRAAGSLADYEYRAAHCPTGYLKCCACAARFRARPSGRAPFYGKNGAPAQSEAAIGLPVGGAERGPNGAGPAGARRLSGELRRFVLESRREDERLRAQLVASEPNGPRTSADQPSANQVAGGRETGTRTGQRQPATGWRTDAGSRVAQFKRRLLERRRDRTASLCPALVARSWPSSAGVERDEPELLSSRKLRSAHIQM